MISWLVLVFIVSLVLWIWTNTKIHPRVKHYGDLIPGPEPWPLVGNSFLPPRNPRDLFKFRENLIEKYGHTSRLWLGNFLYVMLSDPLDIEAIMKQPTEIKKSQDYSFFKTVFGNGLAFIRFDQWSSRRKALQPCFHYTILDQFTGIINRHTSDLVNYIKENHQLPAEIDMDYELRRTFIDIISETVMGISKDTVAPFIAEYTNAMKKVAELVVFRISSTYLFSDFMWKMLGWHKVEKENVKVTHRLVNKIIEQKEQQFLSQNNTEETSVREDSDIGIKNKKKMALLDILIKMKHEGSEEYKTNDDVIYEANTFFFAGHDTSSMAVYFMVEMLARHPSVQEELYIELKNNIVNPDSLTSDDLRNLPLLDRVVKESFRLYPPGPLIGKELINDVCLPSGYTLPKGTNVSISIFHTHRHPDHYDNPLEFNPDNFRPEVVAKRNSFAFIPFSGGPRNCIGQKFAIIESKMMLAKLVYNFRISFPEGVDPGKLEVYYSMVLVTDRDSKFLLHER